MTKHQKIYLVTDGEYSDYRVIAAFEREKDACEAVSRGMGGEVETFAIVAAGRKPKKRVVYRASLQLLDKQVTAEVKPADPWVTVSHVWDTDPEYESYRRPKVTVHSRAPWVRVMAAGRTREAVIKAVTDRWAKLVAERAEEQP